MKRPGEPIDCNICGASKGAANDNWCVLTLGTVTLKDEGAEPTEIRELRVSKWHPVLADNDNAGHACGNNCAQKMVERYLQSGTLAAARAAGDPA
jgi:hypothetical protein